MAVNTRFAMGMEALMRMALEPEKAHTSQSLAANVQTNAVVIRRMLAALHAAKLVSSSKGPSGGSRLLRSPKQITLGDIHRALEPGELFHCGSQKTPENKLLVDAMQSVFRKSRRALEAELDSVTLNQLVKKISKKNAKATATQEKPEPTPSS